MSEVLATPTLDYQAHDATALADLVRRGEVTPDELLDAAIARADAVDPRLNAITSRFDERARRRIRTETLEGPFAGVPFLLKDFLMDYAGERSTYACEGLKRADYRPERSGELVNRFVAAGVVPFGHTNASEFGFKGVTESDALGPCRNPWNLEHSPAGSSGGSPPPSARSRPRPVASSGSSPAVGAVRPVPISPSGCMAARPPTWSAARSATAPSCWTPSRAPRSAWRLAS